MLILWFVVDTFAVWRVTHLIYAEDGPWNLFVRLRSFRVSHRLFGCFYCLSLWVAIPFALIQAQNWPEGLRLWLGLSGGAILLHRATDSRHAPLPHWTEEPNSVSPDNAQE